MNNNIDTIYDALLIASGLRLEVMVVFIFEKPRSACGRPIGLIKKSRSVSERLMTIYCNRGTTASTIHCCDFDKTGAQSFQDFWT